MGSGENLVLTREPSCQYDKWEILVTSMEGDTIGHVARTYSIALGPILKSYKHMKWQLNTDSQTP
eukprot:13157032-Ditylum_brightwellii.AAC.1